VTAALQWFDVAVGSKSPDQLQECIYEVAKVIRSQPAWAREGHLTGSALQLGCLWGQTVCDRLGWEWAAVSLEPGSEFYGVVSPSRSHVVFPLHYMQELLSDPERDHTSLLLYNMLKAGPLPPAGPGEYSVLG
jgi:hypothetical protein